MMLSEAKWKGAGGGIQIFVLILLWYLGVILSASISQLFLGDISSSATNIRLSNTIGSVFLFLVPIVVYMILFVDNSKQLLREKSLNIYILLLSILAMLCFQPFAETVAYYNDLITLPESMSEVQKVFDEAKKASESAMLLLFQEKSISSLLLNILVIAILPGLLEELFFTGCMQRSIFSMSKNIHVAIWTTAFIFSLLHFQLAGFFSRILLGALLGYLYVWTKNIWIPIAMHIAHNASIVIFQQYLVDSEILRQIKITDYSINNSVLYTFVSLLLTIILLVTIRSITKKRDQRIPL